MVKFLIMDVDGTLTDGKIYMGNTGELYKVFDIKDGCGISELLIPMNIVPVIITGRSSKILENRCKEIGITELYQGVKNKINKVCEVINRFSDGQKKYNFSNIAYIGDDINDLLCMQQIHDAGGITGCPADAVPKIKSISDFISTKNGGDGAVREYIEWILCNIIETKI